MRFKKSWLGLLVILAIPAPHLRAQADDRQALVPQIDELRKKLDEMDQRLRIAEGKTAGAPAPPAAIAAAPPVLAPAPLVEPSQRPTNAGVAAGTIPSREANAGGLVAVGPGGFTIQSADANYLLKIGADLQVDMRNFTG